MMATELKKKKSGHMVLKKTAEKTSVPKGGWKPCQTAATLYLFMWIIF